MGESNISFASNVNIITSDPGKMKSGDQQFFSKISDFYALCKLREINGGTLNSRMYVFKSWQKEILCGEYGFSVRRTDDKIQAHNQEMEKSYGYSDYDEEQLFPLIDEMYLNYNGSVWQTKSDRFWWDKGNGLFDYSGNAGISLWKPVNQQVGNVPVSGGGTLFTSYISQEVERIQQGEGMFVPVSEADLSELDEKDPYYYIYHKTAGVSDVETVDIKNREADLYLQKYTLYSAFEEVEQDVIIRAGVQENIFVDAGPGTGKTYTLMNKLEYMIDELEVEPESIMVLCFTNAAVAEIKKRKNDAITAGISRGIRNVDVRTFHSFAWWLINVYNTEMQDEPGWQEIDMRSLSYDGSIIRATQIIHKYPDIILGGWQHYIVDEIQDLTDVRARLVLEITRGCIEVGCGVTVLGDSCQAIYDYNQQDVSVPMTSTKFYKMLFELLYKKASMYKLGTNHRQTSELICMTQGLREAILNKKIPEMKSEVKKLFDSMGQFSGRNVSDNIGESFLEGLAGDGKVCLLCRNNGQVLRLSSQLRKRGVSHIVNAYDHDKCFASWVGAVFFDFGKQQISRDEFIERYNIRTFDVFTNAEEVWERLAKLLRKQDNLLLGVEEIITAIYSSQADDPVFHNYSESKIIVSNIHRAKGREYNSVIVDQNFIKGLMGTKKTDIGEFKTLYVAVTRPKTGLYTAHLINSDIRIWQIFKTGSKRWVKFVDKVLKYMEVRSSDIDKTSFLEIGTDVQKYIINNIKTGDEIILRKSKANEILRYSIYHVNSSREQRIGDLNSLFLNDLEAMIETDDSCQWPKEIRELYVTDVFTHLVPDNTGRILWNWVEFCGIGHLIYDVY